MNGTTEPNPSNDGLQALAWSSTTPSQIDTGSGTVVGPMVVREPDGGGTALAVWVEKTDLNPLDSLPAVYHLYARWFNGATWAGSDVIDTGSAEFGAWLPQVSMDDNGDAIVLWAQVDCIANPNGGSCTDYAAGDSWVTNIYARRYANFAGVFRWANTDAEGGCPAGSGADDGACVIDAGNNGATNPSLAIEPSAGGTAMALWEQHDGTNWRIYSRRFSGGSWATPCPGSGCPIIDAGVGSAHRPKVRMNNAGDALAVFIQFANATCYVPNTSRTTPTSSFSCPHNRLFYRTYTASTNSWSSATDFTPPTSLPSLSGCFDDLTTFCTTTGNALNQACTPPGEAAGSMDCDCDTDGGCTCDTTQTDQVNTETCRAFSDCRLAMDRVNISSAAVVYKSVEKTDVPDPHTLPPCTGDKIESCTANPPVECDCDCWAWRPSPQCACDCESSPDSSDGTDTYHQIRIEAWRNTGVDSIPSRPGLEGTTTTLANFSYLGSAESANCSSTNPSDGDDFRRILNCDFDNPTVAIVPDGSPAERMALYQRRVLDTKEIYYNWFSGGAWSPSAILPGNGSPAMAPQIAMDNAGNGLAVWVQQSSGKNRIYSSYFSGGIWEAAGIIDGGVGSEDHYFNPAVSMDGPGSALALFLGWTEGFGLRLYGVTGP